MIGRFSRRQFCAGPTSPDIAEAKAMFARNESAVSIAVAEKAVLKVLVLVGDSTSNACFVNPDVTFDLLCFRALRVNLVQPEYPDPSTGGNFEVVSWEQLGRYPAEVVLYDDRSDIAALAGGPVWELLPAVQAGQIGPWTVTLPLSWRGLNIALKRLIETLSNAEPFLYGRRLPALSAR